MPTRPRPVNHTRPGTRTRSSPDLPSQMPPRTYTVFDTTPGGYRDYPCSRFIVTPDGELILIRVSPAGTDQYIAAVYAEGAWRSIHATAQPETDQPPASGGSTLWEPSDQDPTT